MENLKSQIKFFQEIETKEAVEKAEEQAQRIIKEAEENAAKVKSKKTREVSEQMREKEAAELAAVMFDGKKRIASAKFELLEQAMGKSMEALAAMARDEKSAYRASLERLIIEAASKLRGTELTILTNSKDKKVIAEKVKELERKISKTKGESVHLEVAGETIDTAGGVVVQTKDKRQIFTNTLEARLAKTRKENLDRIFASLFEGAEGE